MNICLKGFYDGYNYNIAESLITKKIQNEANENLPQKKKIGKLNKIQQFFDFIIYLIYYLPSYQ